MTAGEFFAQHRKLIDGRKADLVRVGIAPPDVAPARDVMPGQADLLTMPTTKEVPMIDGLQKPRAVTAAPGEYAAPKLPKLLGVNATLADEE